MAVRRFGQIGILKEEKVEEYIRLHANPWPEVNETIKRCNISNYSIYNIGTFVFAYFEYNGNDYCADMKLMERDIYTRHWWTHTKPCFMKFAISPQAEYYCDMSEIFHIE